MKALTLILFTTLITSTGYAQQKYIKYYSNGNTRINGFVKDGVLDSTFTEYYENGNKKTEGFYSKRTYKTNSEVIITMACGVGRDTSLPAEGKRNGLWKEYYPDGKLSSSSSYFGGIEIGQSLSYDTTGRLDKDEFYNSGKLVQQREYYPDGKIKSFLTCTYEDKKDKKGSWNTTSQAVVYEYYPTGELKLIKQLDNESDLTGKYIEYWPNGFKKLIGEYKSGKKNGIFREFHENGYTKFEGIIKDDEPQDKQYYSDLSGKNIRIETWKDGKLVSTSVKAN